MTRTSLDGGETYPDEARAEKTKTRLRASKTFLIISPRPRSRSRQCHIARYAAGAGRQDGGDRLVRGSILQAQESNINCPRTVHHFMRHDHGSKLYLKQPALRRARIARVTLGEHMMALGLRGMSRRSCARKLRGGL